MHLRDLVIIWLCRAYVASVNQSLSNRSHTLILACERRRISGCLAAICRIKCYNRLLRYKRALDRVGEIENGIKQDFTNDAGPSHLIKTAYLLDCYHGSHICPRTFLFGDAVALLRESYTFV